MMDECGFGGGLSGQAEKGKRKKRRKKERRISNGRFSHKNSA
jgi:hypothetical protein